MKSTNQEEKNLAQEKASVKQDTMMLSDNELGDIKIHDGVIASLTRRAVLKIEGVSRLAGNALVDNIAEIVGSRRMQSRAINIFFDENNRIHIEVKINIKFGYSIPEVAEEIQKIIIADVENVTGMTVQSVHVLVQDIEDEFVEEDENVENIEL